MVHSSQPQLELRPARPADAPRLAALQRGIYGEGRWFVGDSAPSAEALTHRLNGLDASRSLYLLAYAASEGRAEACAWLELHRMQPKRLEHVAVLTLAVAPPFRQRGVASSLLERSYSWALDSGVAKMQLSVREHNRAAIALYRRQGFVLEGREVRQVREGGRYEDNFLMAKFL